MVVISTTFGIWGIVCCLGKIGREQINGERSANSEKTQNLARGSHMLSSFLHCLGKGHTTLPFCNRYDDKSIYPIHQPMWPRSNFRPTKSFGGALSVIVIIVGSGYSYPSSNPERDLFPFHVAFIPSGKVWIQLFPVSWVRKTGICLSIYLSIYLKSLGERKLYIQTSCSHVGLWGQSDYSCPRRAVCVEPSQANHVIEPVNEAVRKPALNLEISYSYTSHLTKTIEPNLPYYLTIAVEDKWIHAFSKSIWTISKTVSRIWTQVMLCTRTWNVSIYVRISSFQQSTKGEYYIDSSRKGFRMSQYLFVSLQERVWHKTFLEEPITSRIWNAQKIQKYLGPFNIRLNMGCLRHQTIKITQLNRWNPGGTGHLCQREHRSQAPQHVCLALLTDCRSLQTNPLIKKHSRPPYVLITLPQTSVNN